MKGFNSYVHVLNIRFYKKEIRTMKKFYSEASAALIIFLILVSSTASAATTQSASPAGPYAYITNYGSNSVTVIDTSTNSGVATVDVGSNPLGVAVSPDGSKVYVTAGFDVSVIDTSNNTVMATISVGSMPSVASMIKSLKSYIE
jgi:YVTN family beta-propeller protein